MYYQAPGAGRRESQRTAAATITRKPRQIIEAQTEAQNAKIQADLAAKGARIISTDYYSYKQRWVTVAEQA